MLRIEPFDDIVVVEAALEAEVSKGGVYLPTNQNMIPDRGRVIAVGPGRMLENGSRWPMSVQVGDDVLFPKHCAKAEVDGKKLRIMRASEIAVRFLPEVDNCQQQE